MKKLLLKSILLLCALIVGTSSSWADTATITFSNTDGDDSSTALTTSNFVSSGIASSSAAFGTISCSATAKCYKGRSGYGLKVGASSNAGSFTIAFSTALTNVSQITLNRASYSSNKTTSITVKNGDITLGSGNTPSNTDFSDMDITNLSIASLSGLTVQTGKYCFIKSITINYSAAGTTAAPTITGNTPFYGSTTATITNAASADGADIYYTLDGSDPTTATSATCFKYTAAFSIDATTTVKAIAKKSTDTNASSVVSKTFTKVTPMNVASALTAISALANNGTIENQCVRGIVTKVSSLYNNTAINYTISDDIAGSNELTVYRGKNMHNTDFAALSDIKLGDDVVIYGTLKKYVKNTTTTPEFDEGNYLLYQASKTAPTFTLSTSAETLSMGTTETVDVTLTTNTDGAITCESSDDDVATVALKSAGVYTITGHMAGTATITIKSALTNNFQPASATVAITVNDTREAAGISFTEDEVEITWGDAFTGQALTNTHSLPLTWSSTNEAVATVNSSGVVSVLKAGSTDIKATFAGDATYKTAVVAYTLTVNKAEAGLSYDQTEFEIMVGDNSFVAPTLNNPNNLTVAYTSSNETVALVDENTGELAYDANTPGSATITAYFAGNDNYKGGNAKYTLNIIDPTVKGSKYNPYTVAEIEGQASATTFGNNIYVTGYIVGSVSSNKCYKETSSLVNSNLLLADTPDISFTEGVNVASNSDGLMPVELPSSPSSIRTNWGIKDNPSKLGYKILIKGNAQAYFGTNSIKETSEISAISVPLTPAKTYTTLTSAYALDFTSVSSDLKAYIATEVAGNAVQMVQVNKVPAGTGLVLKATTPGAAVNVPVFDGTSPDDVSGNKMAGSATETTAITANGGYILKDGVFQPATAGTLAAGKAYLNIAVSSARELVLDFDDETTGVDDVRSKMSDGRSEYFNLAGQRVAQPAKGLYIVNGKKYVIK